MSLSERLDVMEQQMEEDLRLRGIYSAREHELINIIRNLYTEVSLG